MAITIRTMAGIIGPSEYSRDSLTALLDLIIQERIQAGGPKPMPNELRQLDQVLTRFDFSNRWFDNMEALQKGIHYEVTEDEYISTDHWQVIAGVHPTARIMLYRGCNSADAKKMRVNMSAGGVPFIPNCGPPTESDVVSQVGGSQAGKSTHVKLPEFTYKRSAVMMHRVTAPGVTMGVVTVVI